MSDDDWREERLRARRQREAEEAAAEEAAAAVRAAPPPSAPPRTRPPLVRPPRPRTPGPDFGRTRTRAAGSGLTAFGVTLPPFNILQISLIALGLVLLISVLVVALKPHHAAGDAAPSSALQQTAVVQTDGGDDAGSAPPPAALRPSQTVSAPPITTTGPASSATADPSTGDQPVVTTPARWIEKPSDEEIAAAFPDDARDSDATGRAVVQCVISAAGEPGACSVQSEAPAGDGFGRAALGLAHKFKFKAKTVNGVAVDGGVATISVRFAR